MGLFILTTWGNHYRNLGYVNYIMKSYSGFVSRTQLICNPVTAQALCPKALPESQVPYPTQTTQAHLALSVTWVMDRVWVEALKLIRREQDASLVALNLSKEVLLLIIVSRSHISCWEKDTILPTAVPPPHKLNAEPVLVENPGPLLSKCQAEAKKP